MDLELGKCYKIRFFPDDNITFEYKLIRIISCGNITDYEFEDVQDGQKMYVNQDSIFHMQIQEIR
jgi:hypothetical protein